MVHWPPCFSYLIYPSDRCLLAILNFFYCKWRSMWYLHPILQKTYNFEIYSKLKGLNVQWWQFSTSQSNLIFFLNLKDSTQRPLQLSVLGFLKIISTQSMTFTCICQGCFDFFLLGLFRINLRVKRTSTFFSEKTNWNCLYSDSTQK